MSHESLEGVDPWQIAASSIWLLAKPVTYGILWWTGDRTAALSRNAADRAAGRL